MNVRQAIPNDSAAIAKAHVDTWRSTYRGIISDEFLDRLSYLERQQIWDDALTTHHANNHVYVVEADNGKVVGFVSAGLEREERTGDVGEIYAIYLLETFQGRGWGKQLLLKAAERLKQEGYQSMKLWVLADNPTRGFYEAIGGSVSGENEIEVGGERLVEVAYEWKRLDDLVG